MRMNYHIAVLKYSLASTVIGFLLVVQGLGQPLKTAREYFEAGVENLKASRFEAALVSLRESEKLDPQQASTKFNIGNALAGLGRFTEAETVFRKGIELAPKDGNGLTSLCKILVINRKATEALESCRLAVQLAPDSPDASAAMVDAMFAARVPTDEAHKFVVEMRAAGALCISPLRTT